jgi:hypothetical protein
MTIAAARWAARLQEIHPEFVAYQDGAIIINLENFVQRLPLGSVNTDKVCSADIDDDCTVLVGDKLGVNFLQPSGPIAEVVSERPACAGGINSPQSLREKTVRKNLAAYYAGS